MKSKIIIITLAIILILSFDEIFAIPVAVGDNYATTIHRQQRTMKEYGKMFLRHQMELAAGPKLRLRSARNVVKSNCRKVCYGDSGKCVTVCMS